MLLQLLSFFLVFHSFRLSYAEENPRIDVCNSSNNYTLTSVFSTNLGIALNTLKNNTATTGFSVATTSATNSSQPVTALALCRATLTPSDCQACIDSAVLSIRRVCPNQTEAQVWHTYCMIRYSSDNFINKTDNSEAFQLYDKRDVPNRITFDQTVRNFTENLAILAGKSEKRFAVAKTKIISSDLSVYGYVECTRDIDGESCTKCLLSASSYMKSCCPGKWAIWVGTPTCSIQVNLDPVHKDWETAVDISTLLTPAPVPAPASAGGIRHSRRNYKMTAIGVFSGLFALAVMIIVVGLVVTMKKRKWRFMREDAEDVIKKEGIEMRSYFFDLDVLIVATNNFSTDNILGRGGFGSVYKGRMLDGREIAVKKLAANSMQGKDEFANEVRVLLKMQHRNLVQLLGCCVLGSERILVYEYLPNKSLDKFLFDKSQSAILDWPKRLNIILGVARGLLYLHQDSVLKIIHRDIKASNILLDQQMNPKISDFGLAKLFTDEQSRDRTRQIAGTFGYMAPEYAIRGFISVKSDVFSFGVLILEIISGRKNFNRKLDTESQELLKLARRMEVEGRLLELVDVTIGSFPQEFALRCMRIALLCTQHHEQDRPAMSSTLSMLSNNSVPITTEADGPDYQDDAAGTRDLVSVNNITISSFDGR